MSGNRNVQPIAPSAPRNEQVSLATANTVRDGSGTITSLFVGAALGSVVNRVGLIDAIASGSTSTAKVARLWKTRSGTSRLIEEKAIVTASPTTSVVCTRIVFDTTDILLADSSESLGVTITVAEAVHFTAEGGDF